jgi:hypothetical protein
VETHEELANGSPGVPLSKSVHPLVVDQRLSLLNLHTPETHQWGALKFKTVSQQVSECPGEQEGVNIQAHELREAFLYYLPPIFAFELTGTVVGSVSFDRERRSRGEGCEYPGTTTQSSSPSFSSALTASASEASISAASPSSAIRGLASCTSNQLEDIEREQHRRFESRTKLPAFAASL